MLRAREKMTAEEFNLFNPAYCGFLIYRAVNSSPQGMPVGLFYLILPFVLTNSISESFPRSVSTSFLSWFNDNQDVLLNIGTRIQSFVDVAHDSLDFLLRYQAVQINEDGVITIRNNNIPSSSVLIKKSKQISEHEHRAKFFGRWVANQNQVTVYALLGIRP